MSLSQLARLTCLPLVLASLASLPADAQLSEGGGCGSIVSAGGGSNDLSHFECTCSGAGSVLQGGIGLPGGGLSGGYSSGSTLTCTSWEALAEYDAYAPDGTALVAKDKFLWNKLITASCNTSDCGRFLGFLWSIGTAQCTYAAPIDHGDHWSYVIVGSCVPGGDPEVVSTVYSSPYARQAAPASTL